MKNSKFYFGSNLKMYKGIGATVSYLKELEQLTKDIDRKQFGLFIIPSFTSLDAASRAVDHELIRLGAQNMCWEEEGPFTGEVSPLMLNELHLELIEIGHSERRHIFGEDNVTENKKVQAAIRHGLVPLLCIGETKEEKEYGIADEVLRTQLKVGLHDMQGSDAIVAYEPTWAIGKNGEPASADYVESRHRNIRHTLATLFGDKSRDIPILYGGSVNLDNAADLASRPDVDGLFVGRSAWDATNFNKLIRKTIEALHG
jgi:triosephosphate isomerase